MIHEVGNISSNQMVRSCLWQQPKYLLLEPAEKVLELNSCHMYHSKAMQPSSYDLCYYYLKVIIFALI